MGKGIRPLQLVSVPVVAAALTVTGRFVWDQWAAGPPVLECPRTINLGDREKGEIALGHFRVENRGGGVLRLSEFQTSCSCAGVERHDGGRSFRVQAVELLPGEGIRLSARVAVGGRPGDGQRVRVYFKTNDPAQPVGGMTLIVPRIKGGVYFQQAAVVFGSLPVHSKTGRIIDLYDNGADGRQVGGARSTRPDQFEVRLLPLTEEDLRRVHEAGGRLIARLEVTPRTDRPRRLDGEVEVSLRDEARRPDVIPVAGEVVGAVTCRPDTLVLPRRTGRGLVDSGQVELTSRDGTPMRVEVESTPPGVSASVHRDADRQDLCLLEVKGRPTGGGRSPAQPAAVRLRVRCGGAETTVEVRLLCAGDLS